jgi:HMG (high mobility group) box
VVTTAGHSNTDHLVVWTGNYAADRIAELKRKMATRLRYQQPESKGEDRWDKPRIAGERRRRIRREKDLPEAPPEPPLSGYVVFVGQMTTKIRHDRPNERHNQTRVIQEISKTWRISLTDHERRYYNEYCEQARMEYRKQHLEYRATGRYTPSETFEKVAGVGPWVRKKWDEKNALEREISLYETVIFPLRPAEFDEEYKKREEESKRKRKLKQKGLLKDDGTERLMDDEGDDKQGDNSSDKSYSGYADGKDEGEAARKGDSHEEDELCVDRHGTSNMVTMTR